MLTLYLCSTNAVEQLQQIQKAKAMGLFFHEYEHEYRQRGTCHWADQGKVKISCSVKGHFFQTDSSGFVNSIELNSNDQKIYFYENQRLRSLELSLTVLEDHFYYNGHQSKNMENLGVYEIKLKTKNLLTIIYTENFETFTTFYKHLAKYTILNCFQKHFKLTKQIGHGSTSNVYVGQNLISKEEVALKVFEKKSTNILADENVVIVNQIINLEKLRKYHLSPLIGVYETNDCIILVEQKAGAGNMIDYLQQHASDYNEQLIKNIIYKVLQSLKQLHCAGFIHKDVKPDNILFNNFSTNSSIFLGDFGSSIMKQDVGTSRSRRISSGTLGFVAPEIVKQKFFDEKCDLFSVGSLFYFLFKGEPLFVGKTAHQIYQFVGDDRNVERKINQLTNLTQSSKDLMIKLLKVDPSQRISAAEALNHRFLSDIRPQSCSTGEQNFTLQEYLRNRARKYFQ